MRHAGPGALDALEPLLNRLRALGGLREMRRGIFYIKSRALLHFHEDAGDLYADIRAPDGGDFDRIRLGSPEADAALVDRVETALRARP